MASDERRDGIEGDDGVIPIEFTFPDETVIDEPTETPCPSPDEDATEAPEEPPAEEPIEYIGTIEDLIDDFRSEPEEYSDTSRPLPEEPRLQR